jgi:hypothetical protein
MLVERRRSEDAELIEKVGLAGKKIIRQERQKNLFGGDKSGPCPLRFDPPYLVAETLRRCLNNRRFSEAKTAISFLVKWLEAPDAGLDTNLTAQVALICRAHNPQV